MADGSLTDAAADQMLRHTALVALEHLSADALVALVEAGAAWATEEAAAGDGDAGEPWLGEEDTAILVSAADTLTDLADALAEALAPPPAPRAWLGAHHAAH